MKVTLAKSAGFCFGVKRAVEMAKETAKESGQTVYTYGPLIHNASVISDLQAQGVVAVEATSLDENTSDDIQLPDADATLLIRAHGVGKATQEALTQNYGRVIDATCPFVKKIHRIVEEHATSGDKIVVAGAPDHPEVIGICGWAKGDCVVISDADEAKAITLDPAQKVCMVAQTTFRYNKFQELVEIIQQKVYDILVCDTICSATEERQTEAVRLASQVDAMLVIGDTNSSNSRKLYEICRDRCENTYFLQAADDLDLSWLSSAKQIGITAGASTPYYIIEEVLKKCQ